MDKEQLKGLISLVRAYREWMTATGSPDGFGSFLEYLQKVYFLNENK